MSRRFRLCCRLKAMAGKATAIAAPFEEPPATACRAYNAASRVCEKNNFRISDSSSCATNIHVDSGVDSCQSDCLMPSRLESLWQSGDFLSLVHERSKSDPDPLKKPSFSCGRCSRLYNQALHALHYSEGYDYVLGWSRVYAQFH